jgi:hypothetical protein
MKTAQSTYIYINICWYLDEPKSRTFFLNNNNIFIVMEVYCEFLGASSVRYNNMTVKHKKYAVKTCSRENRKVSNKYF